MNPASHEFELRRHRGRTWLATLEVALLLVGSSTTSFAGPPYATDDPEPVEHKHWEFYLASQDVHDRDGWSGTVPHFEVNYGVARNVQLHVIAPLAYVFSTASAARYGFGDTELGIKVRFVHEGRWTPQIGTFPFLEVPTGSNTRELGNGSAQVFVPVWLQKSFGDWTTYGGGGLWFDLGSRHEHWWFFGWQAQRRVTKMLSTGAELYHLTPGGTSARSDTRYNLGGVIDLSDNHHLLLSSGRSIIGPVTFQGYVAWLVTLGTANDDD